jgi:hypothetical protein
MKDCDLLARITTNKDIFGGKPIIRNRRLVISLLFAGFVLAYPVCAKDEPKYVGDFPDHTKRQNIQIIDDGPNTVPYRHAPIVVVPAGPEARPPMTEAERRFWGMSKHYHSYSKSAKTEIPTAVKVNKTCDFEPPAVKFPPDLLPGTTVRFQSEPTKAVLSGVKGKHRKAAPKHIIIQDQSPILYSPVVLPGTPARPQVPELQSRNSRLGEQYDAARDRSERKRNRLTPGGAIGDFPLPKLNFPREIGPAGKFAVPMTASPSMIPVPAKPMRAGGAAQKGDSSRLRKPTNLRVNVSPIQTYSSGYVPGSTSSVDKSKGLK